MELSLYWCPVCKSVVLDNMPALHTCGYVLGAPMKKVQLLKGRGHDEIELRIQEEDE